MGNKTSSSVNSLLKKFGAFSLGPIISSFLGFLTVPLVTFFITPEEYGKASMFTVVQGMVSMFVYLGMDQAFIREFNNYRNNLAKLLSNAIVIPMTMAAGFTIMAIVFKDTLGVFLYGTTNEPLAVYALAVLIPFMVLESFSLLKFRMEEKGIQYSIFTILLKAWILVLTIILFMVYEKSFRSVVYAMALGEIINSIIVTILAIKPLGLNLCKYDKTLIKRMLAFGIPLIPEMMMSWTLSSMDKIMIRVECGYVELGLYAAAFKIVNILSLFQSCFTLFWTPVAYRWNEENVEKDFFNIVNRVVAIVMSIMCLGLLIVKNVVGVVLGDNFLDAINIFPFLLLYPIMYTMSESTAVGIGFSRKTYFSIVVSGVSCVVNFVLNYLLIPVWGATGAAIATGTSFIVFFWVRSIISNKIWWKFDMGFYLPLTVMLVINCCVHTFFKGYIVYVLSCVSIILVLILNYKSLKKYATYIGIPIFSRKE